MLPLEPEALPPGDLDLLALMPAVGRANRAVATLEGLFYGIPNPDILLSPITTQEAVLSSKIEGTQADFEDVRCRCICPDTATVAGLNKTERRYYTNVTVDGAKCDAMMVVVPVLELQYLPPSLNTTQREKYDNLIKLFAPHCTCKWEERSTTLLKVVIILVMSIIACLVAYMAFLVCLDPSARGTAHGTIAGGGTGRYQPHHDEVDEENIFRSGAPPQSGAAGGPFDDQSIGNGIDESPAAITASTSSDTGATMRRPTGQDIVGRVEDEQRKWRRNVEVQRKNIFTDHTMLN